MLKDFSLKYIDIMIGVILGLGFQWWPDITEVWQYLAFFFIYLNLVDYWIDYSPTIKKFPLKNEIDVILHTFIFFTIFFLVFYVHVNIIYFFITFVLYRIGDILWIYRMKHDYDISARDNLFMDTWKMFDIIEIIFTLVLLALAILAPISSLLLIIIFIISRTITRVLASLRYKKVYYA